MHRHTLIQSIVSCVYHTLLDPHTPLLCGRTEVLALPHSLCSSSPYTCRSHHPIHPLLASSFNVSPATAHILPYSTRHVSQEPRVYDSQFSLIGQEMPRPASPLFNRPATSPSFVFPPRPESGVLASPTSNACIRTRPPQPVLRAMDVAAPYFLTHPTRTSELAQNTNCLDALSSNIFHNVFHHHQPHPRHTIHRFPPPFPFTVSTPLIHLTSPVPALFRFQARIAANSTPSYRSHVSSNGRCSHEP
ncbi:hypothetical protein BDN70DRAFT_295870 [Pholiota conissans]|uniref:Uncharacterized protein n=1 Tax=Pholiota conissans TaxID=109636 RepID=A0A9P5YTG3_9AGAR|nr:hypothetical protein BDN70DRAFT_295870 [Pholiota conissans]